ncbi:hypothetical protein [Rugosibacter aromaticivorans]|nr:hypothetical protein [Rugosibacter aromaticivorans]
MLLIGELWQAMGKGECSAAIRAAAFQRQAVQAACGWGDGATAGSNHPAD